MRRLWLWNLSWLPAFVVDSLVAKGALSKGRISAKKLQPALKCAWAIQIAFDTYPGWCYSSTRLNVPDDPTRGLSLRSPVRSSLRKKLVDEEISAVAKFRFRRFAANWLRLFILLTLPGFSYGFSDPLPCNHISDHFHGFYAGLIPFCCLSLCLLGLDWVGSSWCVEGRKGSSP